jgi:hypothetical protein
MSPARGPNTARCRSSSPARLPHSVGPNLPLEPRPGSGERVDGNLFVRVHGLGVLPQVVQAREASFAVTLERALAGVFPR